ncbi:MAG: alginate export family protein [Armatimonadetes bacterium]|nr:alginate export family protein [Armatimonadota bacterium]
MAKASLLQAGLVGVAGLVLFSSPVASQEKPERFKVTGQVRARVYVNRFKDYKKKNEEFIYLRTRLWANGPISPNLRLSSLFEQKTDDDGDRFRFREAALKLGDKLSLTAGRQMLSFGAGDQYEFLIGSDKIDVSMDGASLRWNAAPWDVSLLTFRPSPDSPTRFREQEVYGLYGRYSYATGNKIDPYLLIRRVKSGEPGAFSRTNAAGVRWECAGSENWKWVVEGAREWGTYQLTPARQVPLDAFGGYVKAVYAPPGKASWKLQYVYLSGDNPGTEGYEGFDPLFNNIRYDWGYLVRPGGKGDGNGLAEPGGFSILNAGRSWKLDDKTTFSLNVFHFVLQRPPATGAAAGQSQYADEVDLDFRHIPAKGVQYRFFVGAGFPGRYLELTKGPNTRWILRPEVQVSF